MIVEAYVYDAERRLSALFKGNSNTLSNSFVYDKEQIVAALDEQDNIIWEGSWRPLVDQLIEWKNFTGRTNQGYIPLADHRNCIVASWNVNSGRIQETVEYDPECRIITRELIIL